MRFGFVLPNNWGIDDVGAVEHPVERPDLGGVALGGAGRMRHERVDLICLDAGRPVGVDHHLFFPSALGLGRTGVVGVGE